MNFFNVLSLIKLKTKKGPIRNKVRIENVRIRVIKCERVLTNYREEKNEERERETIVTVSQNIEESRVAMSLRLQS